MSFRALKACVPLLPLNYHCYEHMKYADELHPYPKVVDPLFWELLLDPVQSCVVSWAILLFHEVWEVGHPRQLVQVWAGQVFWLQDHGDPKVLLSNLHRTMAVVRPEIMKDDTIAITATLYKVRLLDTYTKLLVNKYILKVIVNILALRITLNLTAFLSKFLSIF